MRSSKSRSRNKSNRQRSLGNIVNRVFDSSGPEGKVRGTPQQIIEKYLALARDAQLSGDRVAEQSFLQHAEHYTRMLGEAQKEMAERQQFHQPRQDGDEGRDIQPNGTGGHQGAREEGGRDNGNPRDQGRREHGGRDNGPRDQQRDHREQGGRDPAGRDHAPRDQNTPDQGHREQPRPDIQAESREQDHQSPRQPDPVAAPEPQPEGLPDVVTMSEDEAAGPVETPEAAAKPARSRGPRAPRGDKPAAPRAPRGRRKSPEGEPAPQETPVGEE